MPAATAAVRAWRAEWTPVSGAFAWAEFPTEVQAHRFALRMAGSGVLVRPVAAEDGETVVERPSRPEPHRVDHESAAAGKFADLVAGERPAATTEEQQLGDMVARLRRTRLPEPDTGFVDGLRERLVGPPPRPRSGPTWPVLPAAASVPRTRRG